MEDDIDVPWWQATLRGVGVLLGLMALSGLLMGGIMLVARFLDNARLPPSYSSAPMSSGMPTPAEGQNARTRIPMPYAPQSWPDSPSRRPASGMGGSRRGGGDGSSSARPNPPVGISLDAYRTAVAAGKKVYLPAPKGECNLSGTNTADSLNSLESCFARRAAR